MNIDYIVPGCNDLSYQVCAELNANRNLGSAVISSIENSKNTIFSYGEKSWKYKNKHREGIEYAIYSAN